MSSALLQTKLTIPPARSGHLPRPRLSQMLDAGLAGKLTLVAAPAGYGKTTLIAGWAAQPAGSRRFCWLSLDEGDNDPIHFLTYLAACLQQADADIGAAMAGLRQGPPAPPPEALLTILINDVAALASPPAPLLLVLDDYHLINNPAVHQSLSFLLDHQPETLHLVLLTREDPPLPLPRLLARREMNEIRQADLRFTTAETAALLNDVVGLDLTPAQVEALGRRTEGWVSGLHLAAISLRGQADIDGFVRSFTGSNRYILDYLMDEVFSQQPAAVQAFLLQTSILERFTAPLCDAVRAGDEGQPATDSRAILRAVEQANLFLIPLDTSRQWYRYHHLFAGLLRHRLELDGSYDLARLHRRASQWHLEHGYTAEAIDHALATADWPYAAGLVAAHYDSLLKQGEVATALRWFQALPEEVILAAPQVSYEASWPLILTEQYDRAERYLAAAESAALANGNGPLLTQIAIGRAQIARARGQYEQVAILSRRALAALPPQAAEARCVVALNLGLAHLYRGRLEEAESALREAQQAGQAAGNDYIRLTAQVTLNGIMVERGELRRAAVAYRQMLAQAGYSPPLALAHYGLGRLQREWNDLESAAASVRQGLEVARRTGPVGFQVEGLAQLALVELAQDQTAAAREALAEAEALLASPGISAVTRLSVLATQLALALAQAQLERASELAAAAPAMADAPSFPVYLQLAQAQARLLLVQGERAGAAALLATLQEVAAGGGWDYALVQIHAWQSVAAGGEDEALASLGAALALAAPEGYARTFLDLGQPMQALLAAFQAAAGQGGPGAATPSSLAYASELLAQFAVPAPEADPVAGQASAPAGLAEPLSHREEEVLRLLAQGRTYQEIAGALFLSVNTVKSHLKNIYGKLGVSNRRQAVAQARAYHLLDASP